MNYCQTFLYTRQNVSVFQKYWLNCFNFTPERKTAALVRSYVNSAHKWYLKAPCAESIRKSTVIDFSRHRCPRNLRCQPSLVGDREETQQKIEHFSVCKDQVFPSMKHPLENEIVLSAVGYKYEQFILSHTTTLRASTSYERSDCCRRQFQPRDKCETSEVGFHVKQSILQS